MNHRKSQKAFACSGLPAQRNLVSSQHDFEIIKSFWFQEDNDKLSWAPFYAPFG